MNPPKFFHISQRLRTIPRRSLRGFTLIELIIVIVIMGVLGGMVSIFMKGPIDAYFDSARRAAMTDVADTAVLRMARDIHVALPNSIRSAGTQCVEFVPTKTGGRYRADIGASGSEDILDFNVADTSFDVFGDIGTNAVTADQRVARGDLVAVYNLGNPGSDAYNLDNLALVKDTTPGLVLSNISVTGDIANINSTAGKLFPLESESKRFQVISGTEQVVRYVCVGATGILDLDARGRGKGTLFRQVLSLPLTQSTACPVSVSGASVVAIHVSSCTFNYSGPDLQRNALVSMQIQLTDSSETVSLQREVHMGITP